MNARDRRRLSRQHVLSEGFTLQHARGIVSMAVERFSNEHANSIVELDGRHVGQRVAAYGKVANVSVARLMLTAWSANPSAYIENETAMTISIVAKSDARRLTNIFDLDFHDVLEVEGAITREHVVEAMRVLEEHVLTMAMLYRVHGGGEREEEGVPVSPAKPRHMSLNEFAARYLQDPK